MGEEQKANMIDWVLSYKNTEYKSSKIKNTNVKPMLPTKYIPFLFHILSPINNIYT